MKKGFSEDFEKFWEEYPYRWIPSSDKRVKVGKQNAWILWRRLDSETRELILHILPVYKRQIDTKIVPDAFRWLRDKKWLDYDIPLPKKKLQMMPKTETLSWKQKQKAKEAGEKFRQHLAERKKLR